MRVATANWLALRREIRRSCGTSRSGKFDSLKILELGGSLVLTKIWAQLRGATGKDLEVTAR